MVTKEVVETSPLVNPDSCRKIGKIAVVGRQQAPEIFEIATESPSYDKIQMQKRKTKKTFEEGIRMMYERDSYDPSQSIECFKKVVQQDPYDFVAQLRVSKLEEILGNDASPWNFEDRLDFK